MTKMQTMGQSVQTSTNEFVNWSLKFRGTEGAGDNPTAVLNVLLFSYKFSILMTIPVFRYSKKKSEILVVINFRAIIMTCSYHVGK